MGKPKIQQPLYKRDRDRLAAQVARLEARYERDTQALQSVWDDFRIVEQKRDEARAANAALAAAIDEAAGLLGEEYLRTRNLTVGSVAVGLRAALSDAGEGWDTGEGWTVAKGACNEHLDGCPEGSHRLPPYGAPQPQSRSEERRYKAQGWLPPEVREQDVEAAICFAAHSKSTHENWAEWLGDGGDAPPEAGGLEHHQECIQEYEHIITVLRAALDALEVT